MKKIVRLKQCTKAADTFFGELNSLSLSHLLLNNFLKNKNPARLIRSAGFLFFTIPS
jgi:hypothetical protein